MFHPHKALNAVIKSHNVSDVAQIIALDFKILTQTSHS